MSTDLETIKKLLVMGELAWPKRYVNRFGGDHVVSHAPKFNEAARCALPALEDLVEEVEGLTKYLKKACDGVDRLRKELTEAREGRDIWQDKTTVMQAVIEQLKREVSSLTAEVERITVGDWRERPDGDFVLVTGREHYEVDGRVLWSWEVRAASDFHIVHSVMLGHFRDLLAAINNGRILGLYDAGQMTRRRLARLHG